MTCIFRNKFSQKHHSGKNSKSENTVEKKIYYLAVLIIVHSSYARHYKIHLKQFPP